MRWIREPVKECEGGGVAEDGAGQDGDGNKDGEIEGLISQKRIMTYLRIMVQKYQLHNW